MLVFRLLTTGVCVACVVMLARFEPPGLRVGADLASYGPPLAPMDRCQLIVPPGSARRPCGQGFACEDDRPPVSVLDVAHGVAPGALASLLRLPPTEWVSAIDDRAIDPDLPVDHLIAAMAPRAGQFLDLTVSSARGERRVLVLIH